jgi:hypothetical protein
MVIMDDPLKDIRAIEDKYGLVLFRMGLSHLVDVGIKHLTELDIEETVKFIRAYDVMERANGGLPVMTADFQCQIIRCAAELAQFSPCTLFAYIKKYVEVSI